MYDHVIAVRFTSRKEILRFIEKKLEAVVDYTYEFQPNIILVGGITIKCVIVPLGVECINSVRGMRFIGCFGFDDKATNYLCTHHNSCEGYDLLGYIHNVKLGVG